MEIMKLNFKLVIDYENRVFFAITECYVKPGKYLIEVTTEVMAAINVPPSMCRPTK